MSTNDSKTEQPCTLQSVIARLVCRRWTKWTLIYIYNFSITNRSIEVRQHLKNGEIQFRVKRIAHPVHAQYFDVEDVKKALANVL